jgi:hypothetical protein
MRMNAVFPPMAILMGLNVRVGNEDNLWNSKRQRIATVQQVEEIVQLSEKFGRKVASAEEARKIMKVGVWYKRVEETLQNLGLPTNRKEGEPGFLVWETDGKERLAETMSDSHPMAYCMVSPEPAKSLQPQDRLSKRVA